MNDTPPTTPRPLTASLARPLICLYLLLDVVYLGFLYFVIRSGLYWQFDFTAFYTGWSIVSDGRGAQLYDPAVQAQYQRAILAAQPTASTVSFKGGLLPYINPPHATVPLAPLAALSGPGAFYLLTLIQFGLLVWLLRALHRVAVAWTPVERWLLLSAVAALPCLLRTFANGAFSLFMLTCVWNYYLDLKRGRGGRGGLWLALGTIKPQLVLLPGVVLLAARRWRALAACLAGCGLLVALSVAALGWRVWPSYVNFLSFINSAPGSFGVEPWSMYNFRGLIFLLPGAGQSRLAGALTYIALSVAAVATLLVWRGNWRTDEPEFELRLAFTLLLGLFFSPHLNPQDGLLLVAPATLFYIYLRRKGLPRRAYAAVVLSAPPLFLLDLLAVAERRSLHPQAVFNILLLLWTGKHLYRGRQVTVEPDRVEPRSARPT